MSYKELIRPEPLFWKDRWLNGRAPMYLWPEKCRRNHFSNGTVRELCSLLAEAPFSEDMDVLPFRDHLRAPYENWGIKNGGGLLEMELS